MPSPKPTIKELNPYVPLTILVLVNPSEKAVKFETSTESSPASPAYISKNETIINITANTLLVEKNICE